MANPVNILSFFPRARAYKTIKNAQSRVQNVIAKVSDQGVIKYVIVERDDGAFLPIVLLPDRLTYLSMYFAEHGICVTN